MDNLIYLGIILASAAGLSVSLHIHREKKKGHPMVCPLNFHCDSVVYSKYSNFLGLPVEIMGMIYYTMVGLGYITMLFFPSSSFNLFVLIVLYSNILAFLFSVYLSGLQIFKIKELCSWCLVSALISTLIFVLMLSSKRAVSSLIAISIVYRNIFVWTNIIAGGALLGSLIVYFTLSLWFLRDKKISPEEEAALHRLCQTMFFLLALVLISSLILYLL